VSRARVAEVTAVRALEAASRASINASFFWSNNATASATFFCAACTGSTVGLQAP